MKGSDYLISCYKSNRLITIKLGSAYAESYFANGLYYYKYNEGNTPSEQLEKVTQEEYESNKPIVPKPEKQEPEPTEIELLMQANVDAELRDLEIQQNQELLAQQMADIEVALLGGEI